MSKVYKKLFEADSILEALRPITLTMQILVFPYHIEKRKNAVGYVFKTSPLLAILYAMGASAFLWCMYKLHTTYTAAFVETVAKGSIFKFSATFNVYSNTILLTLIYIVSLIEAKRYPKVGHILNDIEDLWIPLGVKKEYPRVKMSILRLIFGQSSILWTQMIYTVVLMSFWKEKLAYFEIYTMFMPSFQCILLLTFFCIFVFQGITVNCRIICSELEFITRKKMSGKTELRSIFLNIDKTKFRQDEFLKELESSSRDEVVSERLTQYWKIYDRICDYTNSLDETYSMKVALLLGLSFVSMIANLFITLSAVGWMAKGGERSIFLLSYSLSMSTIHFIHMFLTVGYIHSCEKSVRHALNTIFCCSGVLTQHCYTQSISTASTKIARQFVC